MFAPRVADQGAQLLAVGAGVFLQEARQARERLLGQAREEAARMVQAAREEIRKELERGRELAAREAEAIARQMAEKILGRRIG